MTRRCARLAAQMVVLLLVAAGMGLADSVTTTDNLTTNGRVLSLDANELIIQSRFSSGNGEENKEFRLPRKQVLKVEFNTTTFNPGGPPAIGLRPGRGPQNTSHSQASGDVITLRGGDTRQCVSARIDNRGSMRVHCGNQMFERSLVVRIQLGNR